MSDEWKFEVSEQGPGVSNPDSEVCELYVFDDNLDKSLLPLDGGQDSSKLGVEDDPVTLDTLGKQLHRQVFELFTGLEKKLEIITDKIDAILKKPLETELICQLEHSDTVGNVQVSDHELDALYIELLGLEIIGCLQEILNVVNVDVCLPCI